MLKNLLIVQSQSLDPHYNQSVEAALLDYAKSDTFVLYLWTNDHVVFIGKNQNAFLECNLNLLSQDGGLLARRISGGGAVYHDSGNINYTFIAPKKYYNEDNQFKIVLAAISSLGFNAQLSGRNDVTVEGRKFSGNAFYKTQKTGLHHGTVLIKSDYAKIAKYLSASKLKLKSKGVESVAKRVINLSEINPLVTKADISQAFIWATKNAISAQVITMQDKEIDQNLFNKWHSFFTDKKRLYGDDVYFDAQIEHRFDWGIADIRLKMDKNIIVNAKIYSDCLDTSLVKKKQNALIGQDIYNIKSDEARDIIQAFRENKIEPI